MSKGVENVGLLPRPLRCAVRPAARLRLGPARAADGRLGARRRGRAVRRRRRLPVATGELLLERQGDRGQRGPSLLPDQLALLGPEHPRPLPGGDDDRPRRDRRLRAGAARADRRVRRLRRPPGSPDPDLLAVEHDRADRRSARAGRRALGHGGRGRSRPRGAGRAGRVAGADRRGRAERGVERAQFARRRRDRHRRGRAARRRRVGQLRDRVRGALRRRGGLLGREPHRARHRLRRAGRDRPARLRGAAASSRSGDCSRRPGLRLTRRRARLAAGRRAAGDLRGDDRPHLGYAAFLTDPVTWTILAIAAGALVPARAPARDPIPEAAPG